MIDCYIEFEFEFFVFILLVLRRKRRKKKQTIITHVIYTTNSPLHVT